MHEGFLLKIWPCFMGIGHLFLSSLFFKVGVGLKITHSERLPPSLTSFHFWKMSRGSRHIKKAHHLQPFLLLFTIKNWHYSSVPKMKISTSHFLELELLACCHNYCLNDITYSNGDLMLILIEWQVLLLKPFMWWAFCQIHGPKNWDLAKFDNYCYDYFHFWYLIHSVQK